MNLDLAFGTGKYLDGNSITGSRLKVHISRCILTGVYLIPMPICSRDKDDYINILNQYINEFASR